MNLEELRAYCLTFKNITEETPFGIDNLVYKLCGKMFALIPIDAEKPSIVLKNHPERNDFLKSTYPYITEAYHFNKIHWISITNTTKNPKLVYQLVMESYEIIREALPKKLQNQLT